MTSVSEACDVELDLSPKSFFSHFCFFVVGMTWQLTSLTSDQRVKAICSVQVPCLLLLLPSPLLVRPATAWRCSSRLSRPTHRVQTYLPLTHDSLTFWGLFIRVLFAEQKCICLHLFPPEEKSGTTDVAMLALVVSDQPPATAQLPSIRAGRLPLCHTHTQGTCCMQFVCMNKNTQH